MRARFEFNRQQEISLKSSSIQSDLKLNKKREREKKEIEKKKREREKKREIKKERERKKSKRERL